MKRSLLLLSLSLVPLSLVGLKQSPIFRGVSSQIGVRFKHDRSATQQKYLIETMGSGVALIDFDRDGWMDIYFVNGAYLSPVEGASSFDKSDPRYWNRLYRNLGNGTFQDVTAKARVQGMGYGMGVATGDCDNDGWDDLYVTNFGRNILFRNNGDGTFTDVTDRAGVAGSRWGSSAAFLDLENDGDLDLFVVNYLDYRLDPPKLCEDHGSRSYCHPSHFQGVPNVLYRNDGDGTFSDISKAAGIANPIGKGLGIGLWDFNDDGFLDVYIANDTEMNFLYLNNGNGTFKDISLQSGTAFNENGVAQAGMGVTVGDYNLDGRADIFVTNFEGETNTLYGNEGSMFFRDVTFEAGVGESSLPYVGFGTAFFDYDADGDLDLFVANGHILDNVSTFSDSITYPQPNLLYENRNGHFQDVSGSSGINQTGIFVSRGTALGDLDNDGDLDLVVSNSGDRPQILINEAPQGNGLVLQLVGKESNRSAIGARIRWKSKDRFLHTMVDTSGSYLSTKDPRILIGAGSATAITALEVAWPGRKIQSIGNLQAGFFYRLTEGGGVARVRSLKSSPDVLDKK